MDSMLAEIYGTGQAQAENDMEKAAAAELLVKLAEQNNVDLNQFGDAEIAEMVNELYKTAEDEAEKESEETKEGEGEGGEDKESEETKEGSAEKLAEADFLGRVMADSMVQELGEIEKQAGPRWDAVKGAPKKAWEWIKNRPQGYREAGRGIREAVTGKGSMGDKSMSKMDRLKALKLLKHVAPEAGVAAGATAAGVAAHKMRKKHGSALDSLAQERAYELAKQAGWVDPAGNLVSPQVKEASALDSEVERRALQILEANGYPVQWNE